MKKRKRMNDDGFSIVEAMVAIVILSIIFIPVTNSFISSIKASQETKIMQEATSTAQAVMEEFKNKKFTELAKLYTVTEGDVETDTWSVLKMEKEILKEVNKCCDFKVNVTISKTSTDSTTAGMDTVNSVPMPKIYSLESASSYQVKVDETPDWVIEKLAKAASKSEAAVKAAVTKKIMIGLDSDPLTDNTIIYGEVEYRYLGHTQSGETFNTTLSRKLKNLYLFYVADYDGQKDAIKIDNTNLIPGNFYIIGNGANPSVHNFELEQESCTANFGGLKVVTNVKVNGTTTTYNVSPDTDFVQDNSPRTRRYEIKVDIKKKNGGKLYSSMISTRGE